MAESIRQRLDAVLGRIKNLRATVRKIVLTKEDFEELRGGVDSLPAEYRGVPLNQGEIGGSSYVEATGTPSGTTSFAI